MQQAIDVAGEVGRKVRRRPLDAENLNIARNLGYIEMPDS